MSDPALTDWRRLVDKELPGAPFATAELADAAFAKALVRTVDGLVLQPLYVDRPATQVPYKTGAVGICMRVESAADGEGEIAGGADSIWHGDVVQKGNGATVLQGVDPVGDALRTGNAIDLAPGAKWAAQLAGSESRAFVVSTLPAHDAGGEPTDELAFALATAVHYLRAVDDPSQIAFRIAVGRETFTELCKLRALRLLWASVCASAGIAPATLIHAVTSARTMAARDPWVNLLRVSTQIFAAILGGADLVTPLPFDYALGRTDDATQRQARRIARNTALVLRDESQLARVADPTAGAYYFETFTDALARQAWSRFTDIEKAGGISAVLSTLPGRWAASWHEREKAIARRQEPILGVSEFANLDEKLPAATEKPSAGHRDSERFEALRAQAEARRATIRIVTLGPPAEYRARVGFATGLFAVGGLPIDDQSRQVCICGSDDRYVTEAASCARALKAGGATRVLVAGRPGPLENDLRAAGVDDFIYLGCDAIAVLTPVVS